MIWLVSQMWFLLVAAFLLGTMIGWWIWGTKTTSSAGASESSVPQAMGTLKADTEVSREVRPLNAPSNGKKDDLTLIIGIDARTEEQLNEFGIHYLYQIADLGPSRIRLVEEKLGQTGRIDRERWVAQARTLRLQTEFETT